MQKSTKKIVALSIIPQIIIIKLLSLKPEWIESYYSNGLYPLISKALHFSFGWIPFSMGDFLYTIASIYAIRWLVINRRRCYQDFKNWSFDILAAFSIAFFAFHMLWALNYNRLPLHKTLNIENLYSTEELNHITKQLILKVNSLHDSLAPTDSVKVNFPFSKSQLLNEIPNGYANLSIQYPHLNYSQPSIKPSLYSLQLTYMGFSGYLNPFTNEAQIDDMIPKYKYPTTGSHEVAHQLGYAAENEANFIGCMAATHNDNIYFKYSGFAFALKHCLAEIYLRDPDYFKELKTTLNPGVFKNYSEVRDFWDSYQNPIEPLFKTTYNSYLKANNQTGGIESYSYVVALIVNFFEKSPSHLQL